MAPHDTVAWPGEPLAKVSTILDENGQFHKNIAPFSEGRKINVTMEFDSLPGKRSTRNAKGHDLACRWEPHLACPGVLILPDTLYGRE